MHPKCASYRNEILMMTYECLLADLEGEIMFLISGASAACQNSIVLAVTDGTVLLGMT